MTHPNARRIFVADIASAFDPYCQIGEIDWPELTLEQQKVCKQQNMLPIFDAETALVALVPAVLAEIMLEVINRFQPDQPTDDEWKVIDSDPRGIDAIDRVVKQ